MTTAPPLTLRGWLRYDLVAAVLARLEGVHTVLELGAGSGALGARLARTYDYTGLEADERTYATAARRVAAEGGHVIHGTEDALPPEACFDLVCAFEVLEHHEDDVGLLRRWRTHVRPGGYLLLSVPGRPDRFGPWDHLAGHVRRYQPDGLRRTLESAGFERSEVFSYEYPFGLLLETVRNLVRGWRYDRERSGPTRTAASGRLFQPPAWAGWLTAIGSAPGRWLQRGFLRSPRSTGLLALGRAPEERPGLAPPQASPDG